MSDGGAQFHTFGPFPKNAGGVYIGIKVLITEVGTTNAKRYWTDEAKTSAVDSGVLTDADGDGIASAYFDGDYRFRVTQSNDSALDNPIDWDAVKVTSDTATMWEGNIGTSYPSATAANVGHLFAKVDGSNNLLNIGFNNGSGFGDTLTGVNAGAYASLNAAVAAIGATETELIITAQTTVTGPVTVPQTMSLNFARSGSIDQSTHAVTINGSVKAGLYKIFDGSETIIFGPSSNREVYPQWWGALGDDSNDDTSGIQQAVDAIVTAKSGIIRFPIGTYLINSPITIDNAGVRLLGSTHLGRQEVPSAGICEIKEGGSFSGTELINYDSATRNYYAEIGNLKLSADSAGVACVRDNGSLTGGLISCYFHDLQIDAIYGFVMAYCQSSTFDNFICNTTIAMESIIYCNGVFHDNVIRRINKAGNNSGASDTTDHIGYITLKKNAGATGIPQGTLIQQCVMENAATSGKAGIYLQETESNTIENFWWEASGTTNMIHIKNNRRPETIRGRIVTTDIAGRIKLEDSTLYLENFLGNEGLVSNDSINPNLWDLVDADSTSVLIANPMYSARGDDLIRCDFPETLVKNVIIGSILDQSRTDLSPIRSQDYKSSENMFINPSFESAEWGWSWSLNAPNTKSFESSQVGNGLMAHYTWDTAAAINARFVQRVSDVIPASWSNQWLTFSYKVKVVKGGGTAAAYVDPFIVGGGLTGSQGVSGRINAGQGWCINTVTFQITSTGGTLDVGFHVEAGEQNDEVFVDDMSLCFGHSNTVGSGKFGSLEILGSTAADGTSVRNTYNTITYAPAAPTSGTWKDGDIVFNNAPASAGFIGWVCTTPGTPGTWNTWGVIS